MYTTLPDILKNNSKCLLFVWLLKVRKHITKMRVSNSKSMSFQEINEKNVLNY